MAVSIEIPPSFPVQSTSNKTRYSHFQAVVPTPFENDCKCDLCLGFAEVINFGTPTYKSLHYCRAKNPKVQKVDVPVVPVPVKVQIPVQYDTHYSEILCLNCKMSDDCTCSISKDSIRDEATLLFSSGSEEDEDNYSGESDLDLYEFMSEYNFYNRRFCECDSNCKYNCNCSCHQYEV